MDKIISVGRQIAVISIGLQSLQGLLGLHLGEIGNQENRGLLTMMRIHSSQRGLNDGWTRATFILRKHHLEKIKELAYWERKTIKEVLDEALGAYLEGKKIKSISNKRGE